MTGGCEGTRNQSGREVSLKNLEKSSESFTGDAQNLQVDKL